MHAIVVVSVLLATGPEDPAQVACAATGDCSQEEPTRAAVQQSDNDVRQALQLLESGKKNEAQALLVRALGANPSNTRALYELGVLRLELDLRMEPSAAKFLLPHKRRTEATAKQKQTKTKRDPLKLRSRT